MNLSCYEDKLIGISFEEFYTQVCKHGCFVAIFPDGRVTIAQSHRKYGDRLCYGYNCDDEIFDDQANYYRIVEIDPGDKIVWLEQMEC